MFNEKLLEESFRNILIAIGENPDREGLKETPKRVMKSYKEIFDGLNYTNEEIAKMYDKGFTDEDIESSSQGFGEFVLVKNIKAFSCCEHHFLPMELDVHVAYIPGKKVLGLSKLPRVVKHVCKRPQLQERIGRDIFDVLNIMTGSEDIIVIIEGKHMCVSMRGTESVDSVTSTMFSGGKFKINSQLRQEVLRMVKK